MNINITNITFAATHFASLIIKDKKFEMIYMRSHISLYLQLYLYLYLGIFTNICVVNILYINIVSRDLIDIL